MALDGQWQKLDGTRIVIGVGVTRRTQKALLAGTERIKSQLVGSIEREQLKNDFLTGVPAVVDALTSGRVCVPRTPAGLILCSAIGRFSKCENPASVRVSGSFLSRRRSSNRVTKLVKESSLASRTCCALSSFQ